MSLEIGKSFIIKLLGHGIIDVALFLLLLYD